MCLYLLISTLRLVQFEVMNTTLLHATSLCHFMLFYKGDKLLSEALEDPVPSQSVSSQPPCTQRSSTSTVPCASQQDPS